MDSGELPVSGDLKVALCFQPNAGTVILVVDNLTNFPIPKRYTSLPEREVLTLEFEGHAYAFTAGYSGGDGNDLVLALIGEGAVDPAFKANGGWNWSLAKQPDGKILVGSQPRSAYPHSLLRYYPDGSIDPDFHTADVSGTAFGGRIECIRVLDGGAIMISGSFDKVDGNLRRGVARLNPDGTFDPSFDANLNVTNVRRMEIDGQGRLLMCGTQVTRHLADGTKDLSFTSASGNTPKSIMVQPDGKIIFGGHGQLKRLLPDGGTDVTFQVQTGPINGEDSRIYGLLYEEGIQEAPDKLIIAGAFTSVNGVRKPRIARLFTDGSLDPTFHAEVDGTIACVSRQYDGCYIVSGYFDSVAGEPRHGMARLLPDGSLDESFNPALKTKDTSITKLFTSVQLDDGSIIGVGTLENPGGFTSRQGIAKFMNEPAGPSIRITGRTEIRFTLSPTSPDVHSVEMEYTQNEVDWIALDQPTRDATGWILNGASLPGYGYLRVKTRAQSGPRAFGASHSYQVIGRPQLPVEVWREKFFGSPLPQEQSSNGKDPDRDGMSNLMERAFGLNPIKADQEQLPAWQKGEDGFTLEFLRNRLNENFSIEALWSETLEAGEWSPLSDSGDALDFRFTLPQTPSGRAFGRFRVMEE